MKNRLTLRMLMIFVVLGIMFASVLLTYLFLLLFYALGLLELFKGTFLLLPSVSLVVALVLGLIIAAILSRVIITPLRWVIEGMKTVSTGDFSPRVPLPKKPGDLYDLIDGFNTMTEELGGTAIITADHGNADCMEQDGVPFTAHTTNPVPVILCREGLELRNGALCDVAPTMLELLGLPVPEEMTGRSLIVKK